MQENAPALEGKVSVRVIQGLLNACALISHPDNHTKGEYARDVRGRPVHPYDPAAVKFDTVGAVRRAFYHNASLEDIALKMLARFMHTDSLHSLNDLLDHDDLMDRWSRALKEIKKVYDYDHIRSMAS